MKSILDPSFRYVSSTKTNIRATFQRIRREEKERKADEAATVEAEKVTNVMRLKQRSGK